MSYNIKIRKEEANEIPPLFTGFFALLGIAGIMVFDPTSLFSYGYALLLLMGSSFFICRSEMKNVLFSYHILVLFAIVFTLIFKAQSPEYMGMTGHEGGVGTDDCRFYAQIVDGRGIRYPILVSMTILHPFSIFFKTIYPFTVHTPLNLVLVNLIFGAYLPVFVKKLAFVITDNIKIGKTAFWLSLLCPFTLYYSCILVRESMTTLLVIAGLYYFIKKNYFAILPCALLLAFIRLGTLSFLLCGILFLYWIGRSNGKKSSVFLFILQMSLIVFIFYLIPGAISGLSGGKLEDGLIRTDILMNNEDSTIGQIMKLPFPINTIISTVFFLFIPLLSLPKIVEGHYLVSGFFNLFFTPIFLFFLWQYIYNASYTAISKKTIDARKILYLVIIFAVMLGTISLQFRHKTVLFPIICILAAYGKEKCSYKYKSISGILAIITIGAEVLLALMKVI